MSSTLAPCPASPNCVSSMAPADDPGHTIKPLPLSGTAEATLAAARAVIEGWPRTRIIEASGLYLHATCKSRLFGWIDDLELLAVPDDGVLHVRSASRTGTSDLGVNRKRVERLRVLLAEPGPSESTP